MNNQINVICKDFSTKASIVTLFDQSKKISSPPRTVKPSLLSNPEVIQWINGDLSFLNKQNEPEGDTFSNGKGISKKKTIDQMKILEDLWGQATMKTIRPDLTLDKQWTNRFGEYLIEEYYLSQGVAITKPPKKNGFQPDWETDEFIIEVKTQTYNTTGTAGEKILGTPFKYCEIPELYNKPLKIIVIGGAERECRGHFGIIGSTGSATKQRFIDFYRESGIHFVGLSTILTKKTVN